MTDFSSVKGKVAVVTGAAEGLGKAISKCYAENGMKVVVADINTTKGLELVKEIKSQGGEASFIKADMSKEEDVKEMVDFAIKAYGKLDGIVNNAGLGAPNRPIHEYSTDEFDYLTSINLKGVFMGVKYGVEAILKSKSSGGFVINNASLAGIMGNSSMSLYTATKHGVIGITKSASLDYAQHNITINSICPGTFRTAIWGDAPEELIQQYAKNLSPNGRLGDPKEVAHLALFLASDLARYISGAAISIDAASSAGKITPAEWSNPEILN
ncbi:SDR family NAD(P)-dependent oxidoreductase [Halalkalibacter hemicellulosilyticus]|uniref:3-oxoacyl-[acyl-carrier protein] reductase n=1 Tax=Halalkalibacter hemicellulosilyticusJCM 9152 TaxID=1236971 RepID=W4QIS4_9BACI|nr:SDR family NAD(P)-dependent oxidoreductase [Halalkalibacter hemicellulosilyticus]GAE31538.1 3-oxoacyl-[acyl-carrier protein] reductase [Halalkalibacter hemicellulosilyticusJCM 9152]